MSPLVWGLLAIVVLVVSFFVIKKQYSEPFEVSTGVLTCANNLECTSCAEMTGCGWCLKSNQCVETDRNGIPLLASQCEDGVTVVSKDKCPPLVQSATPAGATSPPVVLAPGMEVPGLAPANSPVTGLTSSTLQGVAPAPSPAEMSAPAPSSNIPVSPATMAGGLATDLAPGASLVDIAGPTMSPGLAMVSPSPSILSPGTGMLSPGVPEAKQVTADGLLSPSPVTVAGVMATGSPGFVSAGPAPILVPEVSTPASLLPGMAMSAPAPATVGTLPTTTSSPFPVSDAVNAPKALSPPPPIIPTIDTAYTTVAAPPMNQAQVIGGTGDSTSNLIGGIQTVGNEIRIALNPPKQAAQAGSAIPPGFGAWLDQGLTLLKTAFPASTNGAPVNVVNASIMPNGVTPMNTPSAMTNSLQATMPTVAPASQVPVDMTATAAPAPLTTIEAFQTNQKFRPNMNEMLRVELNRNGLPFVEGFEQINGEVRGNITNQIYRSMNKKNNS